MNTILVVAPDVRAALDLGKPVVALESTIISHGFPYPANVECALTAEATAREEGAVPATIALIGGRIHVGLDRDRIEHLATAPGIPKVSRRDFATLVAQGSDGATTVAATMMVAAMAGIRVFATGGIGGVHRGAEASFDISADLEELARTDVAVVCAGAKSVLDLGLTLEYLETHGVPVLGYATDEFPAFYTRTSGFGVDARLDSAAAIAAVLRTRRELGITGGVVVANPIPREYELSHAEIDGVIETALAEATAKGVRGKEVTPFLLGRIHALTGGRSETANKELVYNNVRLAARIAGALSEGTR
ncbi:MAG: pseudouridine-5'-phosphate glycosidase [Actinomycetota bacterium]|nr:MAG: indigoidine synthesis protein-like [Actinomycetota bacterium]MDP3629428.1 pseudouridine-5'-phosphate glycosidase [Actinomycetota bacterium]